MNEDTSKLIAQAIKTASVCIAIFAVTFFVWIIVTVMPKTSGKYAGEPSNRPILVDSHGMYEYDWDPTDPDFDEKACERFQIRGIAFYDGPSDDESNDDRLLKIAVDACATARAKVQKHRKLLERAR